MRKLNNPFLLSGYYGKEYFCDRKPELAQLRDHIANERNVVLYSWRRMGKTALIRCFQTGLEKQGKTETLYIDLLGTRTLEAGIKQIMEAVYERFGSSSTGFSDKFRQLLGSIGTQISFDPVTGLPEFGIRLQPKQDAEKSLLEIGTFLQSRKKRVLVILDEFQQIRNYTDVHGEALFRGFVQAFPDVRFVFSGSHRHTMQSMFSQENRPFYHSAQLMLLSAIPLQEYGPFILKHFNDHDKTIDNALVDSLYQWSRQQTYCVQLICNKLFGMYEHPDHNDLQTVFKQILEQESPFFSGYDQLLTHTQRKVLSAIAKSEPLSNPHSMEFIEKFSLGAVSSVSTALKALIEKEVIIREGETYLVHDVLYARWLRNY